MSKVLKVCGGSLHSNQAKTVLGVYIPSKEPMPLVLGIPNWGLPSTLFIETAEPLEFGLPVQLMFEVIPDVQAANNMDGIFMYRTQIGLIKACVKSGPNESRNLEHIISEHEVNRFTGLEI